MGLLVNCKIHILMDCLSDLSHANLKSVIPKFHQYVDFPIRGDLVYTNITGMYRAPPRLLRPHLCNANAGIQTARLSTSVASCPNHKSFTTFPIKNKKHRIQKIFENLYIYLKQQISFQLLHYNLNFILHLIQTEKNSHCLVGQKH